ncbi:transcriptional regulator [Thermosporothrix hazakensis]|jgi:hypothetical protein|uniref:Transcriptional regulator n=1 Tax=Thermosporothrix hazakensis TaxID=644383 RepID=A0A326TWV3_THEHA|nr:winged helix-turn-helix domain-containing protein [Thermosporothrix hazakensis]PZW20739.1 transcriptional regulator [Thermosporothrix hazakensis]GCE49867.1 hypothetical protein KTH_47360 [Thermosporothrix hazakensis]
METLFPFLEITGPEKQQFRVELNKDRITIGRFDLFNDVALEPDPQQLISRKAHCLLERDMEGWWVVHNGGVNPTFVRKGTDVMMVEGRTSLKEGDCILLLGKFAEEGELCYWELTFRDPFGTRPAGLGRGVAYLEYDWIEGRLFRIEDEKRLEIRDLRPQEHKLVRYMEQRNRTNQHAAVLCTFEELIAAIWGDEPGHTEAEITHLIWELRQKLETNPREPRFLETVRGLGYRLVTKRLRMTAEE